MASSFWIAICCALGLLGACADSHPPLDALGGETHFLRCERDDDCASLGSEVVCGEQGLCADPETGEPVVADAACADDDCGVAAPGPAAPEVGAPSSGDGAGGAVGVGLAMAPLVTFVIDSSGSMERLADCECTTPGCEECLPECGAVGDSQRNRWAHVLESLTGSFERFECTTLERTEVNGATYDLGYYLPHNRPGGAAQRADGVLDVYAGRLRFGVATFDGWDTYVGAPPLVSVEEFDQESSLGVDGLWSYDPQTVAPGVVPAGLRGPGGFFYPNCAEPYRMDTGIRSTVADEGALRIAMHSDDIAPANADIQQDLLGVRPYGGTPIAAALHDLDFFFRHDPQAATEREDASRERHVVLLTDGYPDDDYRSFGCNCRDEQDPSEASYCGGGDNDPAMMQCPYPTAEEVARTLRCGEGTACDDGIVERVHVVAFAVESADAAARLDAIAAAGGTQRARRADAGAGLRAVLEDVLDGIAR